MKKNFLLGVGITNATEKSILEYILQSLEKSDEKYYIVTPNPEILVYAAQHKDFKSILNHARLALCDGTGVIWAGKILGKKFEERITGVDLLEKLCFLVSKKPITVGFLGGGPKIAERTSECLRRRYPGLRVSFTAQEWPKNEAVSSIEKEKILNTKYLIPNTDILFVAFGFPKQEEWMAKNLKKLPVKVMMAVGGSFDYISGKVPRAPKILRRFGLEWMFRLICQPWRLKRQVSLLEFIYLVLKEKLNAVL